MDEYERLEEDLQRLYDGYMVKFRNQAYLEHQLEEYNRVEHDKEEVGCTQKNFVFFFSFVKYH